MHHTKAHVAKQSSQLGDESPLPFRSSCSLPAGFESPIIAAPTSKAPPKPTTTTAICAPAVTHEKRNFTFSIRSEPDDCGECQHLHCADGGLPAHGTLTTAVDNPTHQCLARFVRILRDEFFRGVVGDESRLSVPSVIGEMVFLATR
mgnify:CR=1 FL=1